MVIESERQTARPGDASLLQRASTVAWRLIPILIIGAVVLYVAGLLYIVVVPLVLALFPATLLIPAVRWLRARGVNGTLAAAGVVLALIALLVGGLLLAVPTVTAQLPGLIASVQQGVGQVQALAANTPLAGVVPQGPQALQQLGQRLMQGGFAGQVFGVLNQAFQFTTMLILGLITLFFYLRDGERMSGWARDNLFPRHLRPGVNTVGEQVWITTSGYFRGQLVIALADAVLIGLGLVVVGVPLIVPLAVLTFFGGLIPIVGAIVAGAVSVLVALASGGLTDALIVLGIVLAVQQIEGDLLQPVVQGQAVQLHPLAVLMVITAGGTVLGVLGAFLAVPVAGAVVRSVGALRGDD